MLKNVFVYDPKESCCNPARIEFDSPALVQFFVSNNGNKFGEDDFLIRFVRYSTDH